MSDDIVDELLDYEPAEMGFHTAANLNRLLKRAAEEIKRLRSSQNDAAFHAAESTDRT